WSRDEPTASAHEVIEVAQLDADGVPAPVLRAGGRVPKVVLLAQLVGNSRGRGIEIEGRTDDFRAAAAVVGDVAQGRHVDTLVAAAKDGSAARLRRILG